MIKPFYTIIKMQVSLAGEPSTMIYNDSHSVYVLCDRDIGESWLGDRAKGFFKVKVTDKKITILKEVKSRDW